MQRLWVWSGCKLAR